MKTKPAKLPPWTPFMEAEPGHSPACEGVGTHEAVEALVARGDLTMNEATHTAARLRCARKWMGEDARRHATEAADLIERQAAEIQRLTHGLILTESIGHKTFERNDLDRVCHNNGIHFERRGNMVLIRASRENMLRLAERLHWGGNGIDGCLPNAAWRRQARSARDRLRKAAAGFPQP